MNIYISDTRLRVDFSKGLETKSVGLLLVGKCSITELQLLAPYLYRIPTYKAHTPAFALWFVHLYKKKVKNIYPTFSMLV